MKPIDDRAAELTRDHVINDFLASVHVLLSAVNELVEKQLRSELGDKLTMSQLKVLAMIARSGAGTISNVATFLGVSTPAASKAIDKLVRRGLVLRKESTDDRRSSELSLTEDGTQLLDAYHEAQNRILGGLFEKMETGEFDRTTGLLDQLSASIIEHEHAPTEICYRCGIYFRNKCLQRPLGRCSCYPNPVEHFRGLDSGRKKF